MSGTYQLWLEFEAYGQLFEEEFCNIEITFDDGRRYSANVWSTDAVAAIVRDPSSFSDSLNGIYALGPDLIVDRIDRQTIVRVIDDLLRRDALPSHWMPREPNEGRGTVGA